jgi:DNA-directed RNA polymerase beta' subunit
MNQITGQISSIKFGIYTPEEIKTMGIKIDSSKTTGPNSVYDERLGNVNSNVGNCISCGLDNKMCPSHFGYIELNEYVIHPQYYKTILNFLKCICFSCKKLMKTEQQIMINGLNKCTKKTRFTKILDSIIEGGICIHCNKPQPKIYLSPIDNNFHILYKDNDKEKIDSILDVVYIKKILDELTDFDVELLGIDPTMAHPKNLILSVLPVLPPACRPFAVSEGNMCDDDLTNQIIEIIKINDKIGNVINQKKEKIVSERKKLSHALKEKIAVIFDNSKKKMKHQTNNRPIKGIKERISGKDGIIRNNLMGKRVNFSARTVIGAEPTLKVGEMAVPKEVAEILTIPEIVNSINFNYLSDLVNSGKTNSIIRKGKKINMQYAINKSGTILEQGDLILRGNHSFTYGSDLSTSSFTPSLFSLKEGDRVFRNGSELTNIKYPSRTDFKLMMGDIVERHLKNGDVVILNRQPTLHSGSMMAMKIIVSKHKTFRFNLAVCKSYNADYDGDEMNIHVPQSIVARTELEELSLTKFHMISPQTSKPNLCIVQDGLIGSYKMTNGYVPITRDVFFDISLGGHIFNKSLNKKIDLWNPTKLEHIRYVYKKFNKNYDVFNGKAIFSLILPFDLIYEKKNDKDKKEPIVKIYKGVLYEGTIDKSIIGQSEGSLIQIINKEYGADVAAEFIDNVIFLSNKWLTHFGFSIGLRDCILESADKNIEIQNSIVKCYTEIKRINESNTNPLAKEMRITACLNKVKDVGMKIATESMDPSNSFLTTVYSGSKGDFFNISQVTGVLGQQTINDKRLPYTLNHGTRALPHYPFGQLDNINECESKGFIRSSFIKGLNPKEMFFHNCAGRVGIINTALMTAKSGYLQRRIVKLLEDIQIQSDQTVRDTNGNIFQSVYGDYGFDPRMTVNNGNFCDVSRIVNRLNMNYSENDDDEELVINLP